MPLFPGDIEKCKKRWLRGHRLDPAIRTQEVQTFRRKLRRWSLEMGWIMHVRALKIHIRISRRSQLITDTTRASEKWLVVHDTKLLKQSCKFW